MTPSKQDIQKAQRDIEQALLMFDTQDQLEMLARYVLAKFHLGAIQTLLKKLYLSFDGREKKETTKILIDFI